MTTVHLVGLKNGRLPIHDLVESRERELGIKRSDLARRCGFKNVAKGIRRIEAMCAGDLVSLSAKMILKALPVALEVSEEVVHGAVQETAVLLDQNERKAAAERDAARRDCGASNVRRGSPVRARPVYHPDGCGRRRRCRRSAAGNARCDGPDACLRQQWRRYRFSSGG